MADKKQTKLWYSTQFPWITLGTEKKINDFLQTKIPSFKSPFEIQDFTNGLYQEALKRQQSRDRADWRADMKRELIQKSETTKNNDEKYRLRKVKNTADLADLIKDFTKKNGVDIGDLDDKTTITQFAKDNPNLVPQINGFLNGNKSATSFGKEIWLLEANYWDKLKTNLVGGISKFWEGVEWLLNKFGDSTIPSSGKGLNDFAWFEKYMNEKYGTTRAISSDLYKKEKENWGNNEWLQSTYTTNLSQDLLNIGEWALDSAFTAIVPWVKAGMSAVWSTKPGEVIFWGLGQAISRGWGMINHIPWLKDFKASLPEQDQERFDAFIGNTIGMMLLWTKGKSRLLKPTPSNLKSFFVENMNPEALVQNFQENVLALPKKWLQSIDHGLSSNSYTKNKELFIKWVKPTVKGKQNITDYARFVDDGLEGIASIVKNKENLKFINDIGEESIGHLPKNLSEFSDAISQTKKKIYSEYDALAKNAGEDGALVSTEWIINELKQLENNRTLRLANPGIDWIISNMKKGLEEIGTLSVEEAQTFSQHLNQNLKAFYKNWNANDIGRSTVEALVNNNLKKAIDESIESALGKGEQYSSLKKQYWQLRNIEEEVAKRALVDQRKNAKNLFDLTDIYSANQVIDSLANLNPIGLVKWGATSLIKNWYKKLNDPNVQIKKLFENIDKEINQNGKLRNKGSRWTDTKEWINEKLGRKEEIDNKKLPQKEGLNKLREWDETTFQKIEGNEKYWIADNTEKTLSAQQAKQIKNIRNGRSVEEIANDYGVAIEIADKITTPEGIRAYGKYGDGVITLAEKIKEGTAPHELFHATFDMVDHARKESILRQIEKSKGLDSLNAEEYLADSFSEYFRTGKFDTKTFGKGLVEKIKEYFYQVKQFITRASKNKAQIKKLFDEILDGEIDRDMLGKILENKKGDATLNQLQEAEGSLVTSPKKSIQINPNNARDFKKNLNNINVSQLNPESFLITLKQALGVWGESSYINNTLGDWRYTLRVSNHNANARNHKVRWNLENNTSVVIKLSDSRFKAKNGVDLIEFVYDPAKLTPEKMQGIIKGIQDWIDSGEYTDKGYDATHTSVRATLENGEVKYQLAYHGSPYEFKQFDSAHMGKGEGAQAHWWGHYVAVDRETGVRYANVLPKPKYQGKANWQIPQGWLENTIISNILQRLKDSASIKDAIKKEKMLWNWYEKSERIDRGLKFLDEIKESDFEYQNKNLYEVEIPDPVKANTPTWSNYLEKEWAIKKDALNKVYEELSKYHRDNEKLAIFKKRLDNWNIVDWETLQDSLSFVFQDDKAVSKFLESLWYDGIHYHWGIDWESYVIFDDNKLEIKKHEKL